jgi:hypothetical protein
LRILEDIDELREDQGGSGLSRSCVQKAALMEGYQQRETRSRWLYRCYHEAGTVQRRRDTHRPREAPLKSRTSQRIITCLCFFLRMKNRLHPAYRPCGERSAVYQATGRISQGDNLFQRCE